MAGLRDLALVFLWAEVYDDFYAPIGSAVRSFSAMGPASMLVRHALNAFHGDSPFRRKTKQAREQREQIVAELKAAMNDPGAFFAELPGKMKAEYTDKWRRHEALRAQPTLNSQFQAGKLAGEVTMELLLTIAGLVALGGAAVKLATRAPQLVMWARRVTVGKRAPSTIDPGPSRTSMTSSPRASTKLPPPPDPAPPRAVAHLETEPLRTGRTGHEMLRDALKELKQMPPDQRRPAFEKRAAEITKETNGQWSAKPAPVTNGSVYAGEGGEALVFDNEGNMYRGHLQNREQFPITRQGMQVDYTKVKPL